MAAGDCELLKGPIEVIRATAGANRSKGHFEVVAATAGFWLHDVANGSEGSFCISAALISMTTDIIHADFRTVEVPAGSALQRAAASRNRRQDNILNVLTTPTTSGAGDRHLPGVVGIVFRTKAASDTRLLVNFHHH